MRSKNKKLIFICFSALIMIALCICVFAGNYDLVGYYSYVAPYNIGDVVFTFSNNIQTCHVGSYYWHFHVNSVPSSDTNLIEVNGASVAYYHDDNSIVVNIWSADNVSSSYTYYLDDQSDVYIYVHIPVDVYNFKYTSSNSSGVYVSSELYSVDDTYTIDIYDNSQDVWASVVSVVNDATDSVINNDILLMFAAALPVLSFGVGMLIRLFHKS